MKDMDYEQKYKAMLEQARDYHSRCQTEEAKRELEAIFPELRESEDEKNWKKVEQAIRGFFKFTDADELLAWLEKQKEQKELPLMGGNADLYFDEWNQQNSNPNKRQCFEEGIRYAQRLQKEQKPIEWSEEEKKAISVMVEILDTNRVGLSPDDRLKFANMLLSLRPCPHWRPSKEQMNAMKYFVQKHQATANLATTSWPEFEAFKLLYNDLKKLWHDTTQVL